MIDGIEKAYIDLAFEFIAALVSEWKIHFAIIISWIVLITMMIGIVYFSNNL